MCCSSDKLNFISTYDFLLLSRLRLSIFISPHKTFNSLLEKVLVFFFEWYVCYTVLPSCYNLGDQCRQLPEVSTLFPLSWGFCKFLYCFSIRSYKVEHNPMLKYKATRTVEELIYSNGIDCFPKVAHVADR